MNDNTNLETLITYISTDVIDELFEKGLLRYPLCESESHVQNVIQNILHRYESNFKKH